MFTTRNEILKILTLNRNLFQIQKCNFKTCEILYAGKLWRMSVGLPKLQTAKGSLTDLPDYSFIDNRPAPLSVGQLKRKKLQERLTKDAVNGLKYLFNAKEMLNKVRSDVPQILPLKEKSKDISIDEFGKIKIDLDFDVEEKDKNTKSSNNLTKKILTNVIKN